MKRFLLTTAVFASLIRWDPAHAQFGGHRL